MSAPITKTIETQVISYMLQSSDHNFFVDNGIDESWFKFKKKEYKALEEFINKYHKTPDTTTFQGQFSDFTLVRVTESPIALSDMFFTYKTYNQLIPEYNKFGKLLSESKVDEAMTLMSEINSKFTRQLKMKPKSFKEDALDRFEEFEKRGDPSYRMYVPTGIKELDLCIGGWTRNEGVCYIGARTNVGKSWILSLSALHSAKLGLRVGYYAGEMTENSVGYRIDTFFSGIANGDLTRGKDRVKTSYKNYIDSLSETLPGDIVFITPKMLGRMATVNDLRSFVESCKLDILFVDQISLMTDAQCAKNVREQFMNKSKDLTTLHFTYQIPVVCATQFNREDTSEKGISTKNISEADAIGQDSALVIAMDKDIQKKESPLVLQVIKNRYGPVGDKLKYFWEINLGIMSFVNEGQWFLTKTDDASKGVGLPSTPSLIASSASSIF